MKSGGVSRETNTKQIFAILLLGWLLALALACTSASSPAEPNGPGATSPPAVASSNEPESIAPVASGSSEAGLETGGHTEAARAAEDSSSAPSNNDGSGVEVTGTGEAAGRVADTPETSSAGDTTETAVATTETDTETGTETASATSGRRHPPSGNNSTESRVEPSAPAMEAQTISAALPTKTVGFVLAISGGSSTSSLKTLVNEPGTGKVIGTTSIGLESKSRSLVLYLPSTGDATVIDTYNSPSYAPHIKRPYTIDDRLFVSDKYTNGGSLSLTEYDPRTLNRLTSWQTQKDVDDPNYALAGDQVYYRTNTEEHVRFTGTTVTGGEIIRSPLSDRSEQAVLTERRSYFDLLASQGNLYGSTHPNDRDPLTQLFRVDETTGLPGENLVAFEVVNLEGYLPGSWLETAVDDGTAWWAAARQTANGPVMEVWSYDLSSVSGDVVGTSFQLSPDDGNIVSLGGIDVDSGLVLVRMTYEGGDYSKVFLYDDRENVADVYDTGFKVIDAEVLYLDG